jgi:hypothetical protein
MHDVWYGALVTLAAVCVGFIGAAIWFLRPQRPPREVRRREYEPEDPKSGIDDYDRYEEPPVEKWRAEMQDG